LSERLTTDSAAKLAEKVENKKMDGYTSKP
jgi:hypothetical protein